MKDLAKRLRARAQTAEIEGEEAAEAGFTLIELMVVLLIIAILLAIAIPTFLGVTNTASDRAAQSNLTNALTEGKTLYEVNQGLRKRMARVHVCRFTSQAPEFNWTSAPLARPRRKLRQRSASSTSAPLTTTKVCRWRLTARRPTPAGTRSTSRPLPLVRE